MAEWYDKYPPAVGEIYKAWQAGVRPCNWSADDLADLRKETAGTSNEDYVLLISFYHALDSGEYEEAHGYIRHAYAKVVTRTTRFPTKFQQRVTMEYAYILCRLDTALPKAKWLLESMDIPSLKRGITLNRAKAALAVATGSPDADALLSLAEGDVAKSPKRDTDFGQAEADWLRDLRRLLYRYEG